MAKTSDQVAGKTGTEKPRALPGFLAEENEFDRRSLLRIGTWGALALAAVVLAVISNQSSLGWHREELAANDLARQTQQIQQLAKEGQNEARRLASAIDTLNNDRDRLYSRVTVLEQGLDSVTGAIAKQKTPPPAAVTPAPAPVAAEASAAPTAPTNLGAIPQAKVSPLAPSPLPNQPQNQGQPPAVAAAASAPAPVSPAPEKPRVDVAAKSEQTPAPSPAQFASNASALAAGSSPPLIAPKSMMGPPDPAAPKLVEAPKPVAPAAPPAAQAAPEAVAAAAPVKDQDAPEAAAGDVPVNHTDFAVDLGSANSVGGLRALWRGLMKSDPALSELHPIIVVKESTTGLGMQLRLAAGPLHDAAAAAKICAALTENKRACETTVFDGQHLAVAADDAKAGEKPPTEAKPAQNSYRHSYYYPKHVKKDETAPKPEPSTLSSLFGGGKK
jgi:hypothetical protein